MVNNWKNKYIVNVTIWLSMVVLLTGCLYPTDQSSTHASPSEAIASVQYAVNAFQEQNKRLPIKNSDMDTPIFEKYVVDFAMLQQSGHLGRIPDIAFEMGGRYFFVLINVEEEPEVKLMDVVVAQQVGDVQRKVNEIIRNDDAVPAEEEMMPGWYALDRERFSEDEIRVKSPYSGQTLNMIVHESGTVAVDYALDLMQLVQSENIPSDEDIRERLVQNSDYVPVRSFPYFWKDGRLVIDIPEST